MHSAPVARVALLSPPFSTLSYALPDYLPADAFAVGQRVAVPLGKGFRAGVLVGFDKEADPAGFVLKTLVWPLEREALLSGEYLDMAAQLANRQIEPVGRILGNVLPAGLRTAKTRFRFLGNGKPRELQASALGHMPADDLKALAALWVAGQAEALRSGVDPLDAELCLLIADPPWPIRPAAKAQNALLEFLYEHGAVTRRKLYNTLGKQSSATLATLAERGLVRIRRVDAGPPETHAHEGPPITPPFGGETGALSAGAVPALTLTEQQQRVYDELHAALCGGSAQTRLLFGITGSGKTAVYLELARAALAKGKSVLLLAPEVALALKLWADAAVHLPLTVIPEAQRHLFHGYQSASAKEATFFRIGREKQGIPRLIIGTRSALMLPVDNIGLIVLDEEHDASFKQDEGLTYQAKEVAWYRAQRQQALLLMGSATPDIKSFHAAREGLIPLHILSERVGGGSLPDVRLVPISKSAPTGTASLLAEESLEALRQVVQRGDQAVILLNRRGYAPLLYCLDCAAVVKCPFCDIGMSYHKARERLLCHYCGHAVPFPSPCSACNGLNFLPMGEGTEKLEEGLAPALPPGTAVLRLDRDSTRRPGRMEEILAAFARKEASVLVGTQMLSKGHHFPDVTLAIVADADLGLNLPDYRAAERTFQLLLQSSGRSGRGEKPGQVLIQTRDPGHYCWEFVKNADYEGFFQQELALRKRRLYPPFVRLALIRISHPMDAAQAQEEVTALGAFLRKEAREAGVTLLGPAPAPLPFLKGRRRWHCLLKASDWQPLRSLYILARDKARKTSLRVKLDLDPVNML